MGNSKLWQEMPPPPTQSQTAGRKSVAGSKDLQGIQDKPHSKKNELKGKLILVSHMRKDAELSETLVHIRI